MNIKTYNRRMFRMYPWFALCFDCWGIGEPARTEKKARQKAVCTCHLTGKEKSE